MRFVEDRSEFWRLIKTPGVDDDNYELWYKAECVHNFSYDDLLAIKNLIDRAEEPVL